MKTFTTILTLFAMTFIANGQVIPNYNFETWTNGTNAAPDGWRDHGSAHPGFYAVTQSTEHTLGSYSVKIENKILNNDTTAGIIETIYPGSSEEGISPVFPVNAAYTTIKGYYKYLPQGGDSAQVICALFKTGYVHSQGFGNIIAFGHAEGGAAATFTPFSSDDFFYDGVGIPDSAYISVSAYKGISLTLGGNQPVLGNSVLYIDALNFDDFITGINHPLDITRTFLLYPIAGTGDFNLSFETDKSDYTTIKVYDLEGREVKNLFAGTLNSGTHTFHYSINDLESSAYLLVVATGSGYRSEKIYITK